MKGNAVIEKRRKASCATMDFLWVHSSTGHFFCLSP